MSRRYVFIVSKDTRDSKILARLSQFSPQLYVEPETGFFLEATGCTHLFGSERVYLASIQKALNNKQVAMAPTPLGAKFAAHALAGAILKPEDCPQSFYRLSLCSLIFETKTLEKLLELGYQNLGEVIRLPRAFLFSQVGNDGLASVELLLGERSYPLYPATHAAPKLFKVELDFDIRDASLIARVFEKRLRSFFESLQEKQQGLTSITVLLLGKHGFQEEVTLEKSSACGELAEFTKLLALKLEQLSLKRPIEKILMTLGDVSDLFGKQSAFVGQASGAETEISELADLLTHRLHENQVYKVSGKACYLPEKAFFKHSAKAQSISEPQPCAPQRPTRLFKDPIPIRTLSLLPDSPPEWLLIGRKRFEVVRALGPERIEGEWWQLMGARAQPEERDYFRLEDKHGRRLWVFRQNQTMQWFLHGLFS